MSNKASRTKIRDPRKAKRVKSATAVVATKEKEQSSSSYRSNNLLQQQSHQHEVGRPIMPFEPAQNNQQSLGLGSYMLAGVGVALGFTLVGAIFGGIG